MFSAVTRASTRDEAPASSLPKRIAGAAAAMAAAAMIAGCPLPAHADIQTVPPNQLTQLAKPLPKQTADKGKIWTVFIGGAAALFVVTVAAENNADWFPAISKANKAMAMARKGQVPDPGEEAAAAQAEAQAEAQAQAQAAAKAKAVAAACARREAEALEAAEVARQAALVESALSDMSKQAASSQAAPNSAPPQTPGSSSPPTSTPGAAEISDSSKPLAATSSSSTLLQSSPTATGAAAVAAAVIADAQKTARLEGFVSSMVSGSKQAMQSIKKGPM